MESDATFNRRAARKQAEKQGFDPEDVLVCVKCGRTVVRKQNAFRPGRKDGVFCTCESAGPPMVQVVHDDDE